MQVRAQKSTQISKTMKNGNVTVTAKEAGPVIVVSEKNGEYGYVRVVQERMITDDRGWIKSKVLTALAHGTVADLQKLDWKTGQEVAGKIVIKEQLTPFNTDEPKRDEKVAGKTGIICTKDGQTIYHKTIFSFNPNVEDTLIAHSNKDEIVRAYEALKTAENVTASKSLAE